MGDCPSRHQPQAAPQRVANHSHRSAEYRPADNDFQMQTLEARPNYPNCTCKYGCGLRGFKDDVERFGPHHAAGCPRVRPLTCKYGCGAAGTENFVRSNGRHHGASCPLARSCVHTCKYCGVPGTDITHIDSIGDHHQMRCPRRTASFCHGCDVHDSRTLLTYLDLKSIWSPNDLRCPGETVMMNPRALKFCQDSIAASFRDGSSVFKPRPSNSKILACFHLDQDTRLFALNNRTLFNSIVNGHEEISVTIVEKPSDWARRFTGQAPWMCIRVREARNYLIPVAANLDEPFMRIPAESFPSTEESSTCWVVLEARNLVNPKSNTLLALLKEICPDMDVQSFVGQRAYARVRVRQDDEPLVRSAVKAIAARLGKRPNVVDCFEVEGERRFDSPRD